MDELTRALKSSILLENIPEDKYQAVFSCLEAKEKHFTKDQMILSTRGNEDLSGIVVDGRIELTFYDENGNQVNVNHIKEGEIFGAEIACAGCSSSFTNLRALTDCTLVFLNFSNLLNSAHKGCPYCARVTSNLLKDFAKQTQFLKLKIRIMAQKRLRDKVRIYLESLPHSRENIIQLPFNRTELAEFLCVDRSALSRELCRMRDEELLSFQGREIQLLEPYFL